MSRGLRVYTRIHHPPVDVTGFEVQRAAAAWPRWLFWLGLLLWMMAAVVFVRTPHREH